MSDGDGELQTSALRDIRRLRQLLALRHGCDISALYGDDGELQCKQCGVDFVRYTVEQISDQWMANGIKQLKALTPEELQKLFGAK